MYVSGEEMKVAKIRERFPCGYEYEIEVMGRFFDGVDVPKEDLKGKCPLHNKDCKNIIFKA